MDFACSKWNEIFLNLARQYIPNKVVKIRTDDKPWYTSELRKLSRKKNSLHRKAKRTNSPADWNNFRMARNQYTGKIREAASTYKTNLALKLNEGIKTYPKSCNWWQIARQFMGKKKGTCILAMQCRDHILVENYEKAEEFNNAFLTFATIDTSNASLPDIAYKTNSRLDSINITQAETLDILKSLDTSKATGPDGISCKMLKETANAIAPSFTRLLQMSLSTATFPSCWKQANVLPIFKKGDRSDFGNYRPVSLLNICSKVCQKIIFKHLFNYCRDYDIISMHQSGFTPGDSTVHQLVYLYNTFCKALNDKKDIRIVFCDQSKAFDRVWHQGLLYKLECIGITGDLLSWFRSYLHNREQRVIIHGSSSKWGKIPAGVPQGAFLGPLTFLIYINDITENIKSNIKLFADDTSLYVTIDEDAVTATNQLNEDLSQISKWADTWLVKFNASKSKALTVTLKRNLANIELPLSFNNTTLETVDKHKHLGVELSTNLSWKDHVTTISENAGKKLHILAKLKNLIDRKTLTTMYTSFIRPGLEYGSIVFCNCTETEDEILESVQRRAFKIITGGIVRTPTNNLYNEIGMETLKVRRERNVLLFFFKIIHNMVPSYLQELKPDKKKSGRYTFRTKNDFVEPDWRITKYRKSFLPFAISLWNRLDENTRKITNYESFKDTLMANTIDNPLFYVGSRQEQRIMAKLRMGGSNLNVHLYSMKLIDSPACSCGFINENEFHFFLVCPLYNRPRVTLQNAMGNIAPFTLRTLLYGSENLDLTVNKRIVTETLRFIKDSKRFDP